MASLTAEEIRARNYCLSRERRRLFQHTLDLQLRGSDAEYKGLLERTEAIAGRNYDGTKERWWCDEPIGDGQENEQRA